MENEQWKVLEEFPAYEVSDCGNVRRKKSKRPLRQTPNQSGYNCVCLCMGNVKRTKVVHRLVAKAFITNQENYPQVDHINRNTQDNSIKNLRWVTAIENADNRLRGVTGEKYISEHYNGKFFVKIANHAFYFTKLCNTLQDAIRIRDEQLAT
jgi:hypothetical protein